MADKMAPAAARGQDEGLPIKSIASGWEMAECSIDATLINLRLHKGSICI